VNPRFARRRYGSTNYLYLLAEGDDAVLVDPGDADAAMALCAELGVTPRWILHTHGHADHSGGSEALRRRLGARVLGHAADGRWFAPDEDLAGRTSLELGAVRLDVHEVPGHTPGSVLLGWRGRLFTGDTLFWGGCGNCRHGGDVVALARSFLGPLSALAARDGSLLVHPGHDYAEANLPFVLSLEPGNAMAARRLAEARAARAAGQEPEPSRLAEEREANPFLRASDAASFLALRARRDAW